VISVVDLRVKFGLAAAFTERSCVGGVQLKLLSAPTVQMGLIVDRVEDVVALTASEIEATPEFGVEIDTA